jgi:hypothetical protein
MELDILSSATKNDLEVFMDTVFEELVYEYKIANEKFKFWYIVAPYFRAEISQYSNAGDNAFPTGSITFILEGTISPHGLGNSHESRDWFEYCEDRMRNRWSNFSRRSLYWINGTGYNVDFDLKSAIIL